MNFGAKAAKGTVLFSSTYILVNQSALVVPCTLETWLLKETLCYTHAHKLHCMD